MGEHVEWNKQQTMEWFLDRCKRLLKKAEKGSMEICGSCPVAPNYDEDRPPAFNSCMMCRRVALGGRLVFALSWQCPCNVIDPNTGRRFEDMPEWITKNILEALEDQK